MVVAVDLGGTTMKGALIDAGGGARSTLRRPTPADGALEATLEAAASLAAEAGDDRLVGIALAVPGVVEEAGGVVRFAANLGWREVRLGELARERLGAPATVLHDVRAAALAEGLVGAARGWSDFLLITLGTGVGAAVVIGGRPYVGGRGFGGELGHVTVDPAGPMCGCGRRGCLEAYASGGHISRRYRERSGRAVPAEEVAAAAAAGEDAARAVWGDAVEALATALADYTLLLDPGLVVVGGGLAQAGEALFGPLGPALAGRLPFVEAPRVVASALGVDAGRLGAAIAAFRAAGFEDFRSWSG